MSTSFETPATPAWRQNLRPVADPGLGDPGPFYCYSVSVPVGFNVSDWVRAFDANGRLADRVEPGALYCVRKDHIITDVDVANGKGEEEFEQMVQGAPQRVTNVPTNPADNKRLLTQIAANHSPNQGGSGLVWLDSFKGLTERAVKPALFSSLLRPVTFTPEYQEDHPEIVEPIKSVGALALYKEAMLAGIERIKSREFANEHGQELQRLYLSAIPALNVAYRQAERYFNAKLNEEDAYVQANGAKGATYSHLAEYCFYMTARKPVNTALQRALQPQEIVLRDERQGVQAPPALAQVQCENCGAMSNRMVETSLPPTLCWQCKKKFPQPQTEETTI